MAVLRHQLGRLALVGIESLLHALRISHAPLPLPVAVLLHLFRVVDQIEHFNVELVPGENLFKFGEY